MHGTFDNALKLECDRILRDPVFKRSPMQSKMLSYLVRRTLDPSSGRVTQFDIATSVLDRSDDFDERLDSAVRVQISRLRQSLEGYYSRAEPFAAGCVFIKPGEYKLRLASRHIAYPKLIQEKVPAPAISGDDRILETSARPPESETFRNGSNRKRVQPRFAFAAGGLFAFAAILIMASKLPTTSDSPVETSSEVSRVVVAHDVEAVGFSDEIGDTLDLVPVAKKVVEDTVARSIIAESAAVPGTGRPDYFTLIRLERDGEERVANLRLSNRQGQTVFQSRRSLSSDNHEAIRQLKDEMIAIVSPPGILARHIVKTLPEKPRTGLECFISVEVGRTRGAPLESLVKDCQHRFSQTDYYPFFVARNLFWEFQREAASKNKVSHGSAHWHRLSDLLQEFPDNAYVNTLAAKVLYANGDCGPARTYVERLDALGSSYPALELMLATEMSGCELDSSDRARLTDRVLEIVEANKEPHAYLQLYEMTALIAMGQKAVVNDLPEHPFTEPDNRQQGQIIRELRSAANGARAIKDDRWLRAMVWNSDARQSILRQIRTTNASVAGASPGKEQVS